MVQLYSLFGDFAVHNTHNRHFYVLLLMTVSCVQYTQCVCLCFTWVWSSVGEYVCYLASQFNLVVELCGGQNLVMGAVLLTTVPQRVVKKEVRRFEDVWNHLFH